MCYPWIKIKTTPQTFINFHKKSKKQINNSLYIPLPVWQIARIGMDFTSLFVVSTGIFAHSSIETYRSSEMPTSTDYP